MKSAGAPPRTRSSSARQRARPIPGTGSRAEGRAEIRQRVVAALGWPKLSASAIRRTRRSASPMAPLSSAAS